MGNCKTKAERKRLIMVNKARAFCNVLEQMDRNSLFIEKPDAVNKPYINEYREKLNNQEEKLICRILTVDEFENQWFSQHMVEVSNMKYIIKNVCPWIGLNQLLIVYKEEINSRGSMVTNPFVKENKEKDLLITELAFDDFQFTQKLKEIVSGSRGDPFFLGYSIQASRPGTLRLYSKRDNSGYKWNFGAEIVELEKIEQKQLNEILHTEQAFLRTAVCPPGGKSIFGVFELKDMNLTEFFTVHEFPIQQKSNQEWEELINKQLASCFDYDNQLYQVVVLPQTKNYYLINSKYAIS